MAIRTCDNCERTLGHLEAEFAWQGHRVCAECHARLLASVRPLEVFSAPVPATLTPQVVVLRHPKKPWPFYLAMGLFVLAMVPISIEFLMVVQDVLAKVQTGDSSAVMGGGSIGSDGGPLAGLLGLVIGVGNLVGFLAAWYGHKWGAWVAMATALGMVAMEAAGLSIIGLKATPLYMLGLVIMLAGFGCLFLPAALLYYRHCAAFRRGEVPEQVA